MIGIQTTKFSYLTVDGLQVNNGNVFYFMVPDAVPDLVYNVNITEAGPRHIRENVKRIIELTDLKNLLRKESQLKLALGNKVKQGGGGDDPNHILNQKITFIRQVVHEISIFFLKSINRILWVDTTNAGGNNFRWKETGISFETALSLCKEMAKDFSSYMQILIDIRFDPNMVSDKITSDFNSLIEEYRGKMGYLEKKKNKNKSE